MNLVIPVTIASASSAVYNTMGLYELVTNVRLNIADGNTNRDVINCSGGALVRRHMRIVSGLDGVTGTTRGSLMCLGARLNLLEALSANSSDGTYYLVLPFHFRHPQVDDPLGSATMLPLPRYNTNPLLTVTLGNSSNVLTSGSATITIGTPWLRRNMRQVDNIQFPSIDTEFREVSYTQAATGSNIRATLDVPGNYTCLDIYTQNSSGVGTDISGNNLWYLQYLSQSIRQFYLSDIKRDEQFTMGNDVFFENPTTGVLVDLLPGYFHIDFLHDEFGMEIGEFGSLLNTNVLAGSGSLLEVMMSLASTGTVNFAFERFFGDLSPYSFNLGTAAG
jgi:hypothetical protein